MGKNINSKVLAFAFSLSADIERQLISQRTKGSLSKETKLSGKEQQIIELLDKKVSHSAIGRIMGLNRITVAHFVKTRGLNKLTEK